MHASPDAGHLVIGDIRVVVRAQRHGITEVEGSDTVEQVLGHDVVLRCAIAAEANAHALDDVIANNDVIVTGRRPNTVSRVRVFAAAEGPSRNAWIVTVETEPVDGDVIRTNREYRVLIADCAHERLSHA